MGVADYNTNPDLNTTINGINIAEGCPPSGINDAIRQLMADVKADKTAQDTATDNAQSAADAAQSAADAAQSAADAAQSAADASVKTVNGNAPDAAGNVVLGAANGIVTVGTVIAFAANADPDGYLICAGAAVSRTTYAALFAAIGTTYGGGDGSTTFNLPDLIGRYIEGEATAGIYNAAGLPNITGLFFLGGGGAACVTDGAFYHYRDQSGQAHAAASGDSPATITFQASKSNPIYGASTTVQPPSLTMRYYIKY